MSAHHSHNHDHHGHHHHHHTVELTSLNRAFMAGIVLNSLFVVIEVAAGFYTNSLALLTDAGHNLGDVAGLAMALVAFRLSKVKSNQEYTYGYSKTTILVALGNAVVLLLGVGGIGYEAIVRFMRPEPADGNIMAVVAGVGIIVNTVSALLFLRDKDHDLNVKGAFLHLAADALVSLGVVVAGILIFYTHIYWIDSAVSLVIMVVILYSTWGLLRDSLRLSLDAVPANVNLESLKATLLKIKGVCGIHHVHVWALSTQVNALTAHLVIAEELSAAEEQDLKNNVKHQLLHLNIQHATLETERGCFNCKDEEC